MDMLPVTAIGSDGSMTHESCLVTFPGSAAGAAALKLIKRIGFEEKNTRHY